MAKSTKKMFLSLFNLLICFTLCCCIYACGSSGGRSSDEEGETYTLAITTDPPGLTLKAGESVTITATVTNSTGDAVSGQAIEFTIYRNNSGGTLTIQGTGTTDNHGQAEALYTVGSSDPTEAKEDIIHVSIPDSSQTITISREAGAVVAADVASIDIAALPTSIKTDGLITSTISVNVLNSSNAALSGITVTLGTDTGVLSAPTITTPGTVILSCGNNKVNRTATITATAGTVSTQIPVQIVGSTVTVISDASSISPSGVANLTVTAKDAGGNVVSGAAVTLTQSGTGSVTLGTTTGTTDASGQLKTTATGGTPGTVTIMANALGATGTINISISSPADTFAISHLILDGTETANNSTTALKINTSATPYIPHSLQIMVHAPAGITNVIFATTIGVWDAGTLKTITKAAYNHATYGRIAEATLTTTTIGVANVQVYDAANAGTNDTLTVGMSSGEAAGKIFLQAVPTVVPISVGTTTGSSTLTATVTDLLNNPLGGQPVAFEIVDGTSTSGGETVLPVVVMTATTSSGGLSVGQARAIFTSGSMPSGSKGVQIRASVVETTVETEPVGVNVTDSGNDVAIVIGGVAGSIAFGQDSKITPNTGTGAYIWPMSILVADSNGNAVSGVVVNLSLWPIGWSTGSACSYDADYYHVDDDSNPLTPASDDDGIPGEDPPHFYGDRGTFWNEDRNENLFLDSTPAPPEDGRRCYYFDPTKTFCITGTTDTYITPTNSYAGTLPATVTTDSNGVATFNLTYPKQSAIWTIDRIRATTYVQGSETRGEITLRLPALKDDVEPTCYLGNSPYKI